jgi:hypothetical protein
MTSLFGIRPAMALILTCWLICCPDALAQSGNGFTVTRVDSIGAYLPQFDEWEMTVTVGTLYPGCSFVPIPGNPGSTLARPKTATFSFYEAGAYYAGIPANTLSLMRTAFPWASFYPSSASSGTTSFGQAMVLCSGRGPGTGAGSNLSMEGRTSWKTLHGTSQLRFTQSGPIRNDDPEGSRSGTVKMVLWASRGAYPASGYRLASSTLGQLDGGSYWKPFKRDESMKVPRLSGNYFFTIVFEEFTTRGWITNRFLEAGRWRMKQGRFLRRT